jgi:predicted amidohydrolase
MELIGLQLDPVWEDPQANGRAVQALATRAAMAPGGLLVLPEMFATGFSMNTDAVAEPRGGSAETCLQTLAREHRVTVIGGVASREHGRKARNLALAFDETGAEVACYSKLHPFSFAGETQHYEPGREVVTFAWGAFTVGLFICYDLRFPEVFRTAVQRGADLLVVIACWPAVRAAHWRTLLCARAIENQAYVIGVNRCGTDPNLAYAGGSLIVDPRGAVLADGGDQPGILRATVHHRDVVAYREAFPALRDIRPEYHHD